MSAQQLSDECKRLGAPIPRTVLSNLENGRRGNVTVAELLVLARALKVPPGALVFPVGYVEKVQPLPEITAEPLDAVDWLAGRRLLGSETNEDLSRVPVHRYRQHQQFVNDFKDSFQAWKMELERSRSDEAHLAALERRLLIAAERVAAAELAEAEAFTALRGVPEGSEEAIATQVAVRSASARLSAARAEAASLDEELTWLKRSETVRHAAESRLISSKSRIIQDRKDMEQRGWILPSLPDGFDSVPSWDE